MFVLHAMPSNNDIAETVMRARGDAQSTAADLGIINADTRAYTMVAPTLSYELDTAVTCDNEDDLTIMMTLPAASADASEEDVHEDLRFDLYLLQKHNHFNSINNLKTANGKLESKCLRFTNDNGEAFYIKKSTLCWLLNNNPTNSVSSDRIKRYIVKSPNKPLAPTIGRRDTVQIGDWCEFGSTENVGQVIGFTHLTGSRKERAFTQDSVPISCGAKTNPRGVGVLCNWFAIGPGFVLEIVDGVSHEYINISDYKAHLNTPYINDDMQLVLNEIDCVIDDEDVNSSDEFL